MSISAAQVKELRERTGAGMMECKKALVSTQGDMEKAVEYLRKTGLAKADKKASRVAAEGILGTAISEDFKKAVMIEFNCETDFVGKGEALKAFADEVAQVALKQKVDTVEQLSEQVMLSSKDKVEDARQHLIAKIGENILIRRLHKMTTQGVIGQYIHGSKIGVLVELTGDNLALAKDLAMHIAASHPVVVDRKDVSAELIEKEKEIFAAQAQGSGKPKEIIEKMIEGRVNKFLDEVSLLGQPFIKDPDISVRQLLKTNQAEVLSFVRYMVGEGIEKKEDNFVQEVMSQVQQQG